jgi:hypothetical protein
MLGHLIMSSQDAQHLAAAFGGVTLSELTELVETVPDDGSVAVAVTNMKGWLSVKLIISTMSSAALEHQSLAE